MSDPVHDYLAEIGRDGRVYYGLSAVLLVSTLC